MSTFDRAWLWVCEQVAFLAVLVVLLAAFFYLMIDPGRWGRSTGIVAASMLLAALLRAGLPAGRVGLLAVRGRVADTLCFLVLGGVLLAVDIRLHG